MEVSLYNSTVCRLCAEENTHGVLLYSCEENNQNLCDIINAYLPLKVSDDGQLPRTVCPGCTIQIEATVEFFNIIINGQKVIRNLHQRENEIKRAISSAESNIESDKIVYEINTNNGIYPEDHPMALQAAGLDKPKRRRGRPPKKLKSPEELVLDAAKRAALQDNNTNPVNEDAEVTGKRRRKAPTRFREAVQGKELERIFKEEGVIDGDESDNEKQDFIKDKDELVKVPEVIGHMVASGEEVILVKGKGRGRPKGRMRPTHEECGICGMEFSCVGRYMSHIAQHGPVIYQCEQCSLTFATRLLFTQHQHSEGHTGQIIIQNSSVDNVTPVAEETVPSNQDQSLNEIDVENGDNKESIVESKPYIGESCEDEVSAELIENPLAALEVDPLAEASDHPYGEVNVANDSNISNDTQIKEQKEEEIIQKVPKGKVRLECNLCDKTFSSRQSKSIHIKAAHYGERSYVCRVCGAAFGYPRSLVLHSLKHCRTRASTSATGYACDLCGKVLNHPSSVVYHKEAEHAGQRYACNKCGKLFKHKQLLQRHQLVHSQARPFTCKTCGTGFKTKANLMNHTLLHYGVKRFSCEICKQRFAHKTSLTLHMRWHAGVKPYACRTCGKSFTQKGNLAEHERIHSGEKPYQCSLCPRRFTTSSQHRLHARRHNPDRVYVCTHCGKRFNSRNACTAHQRRVLAAGCVGVGVAKVLTGAATGAGPGAVCTWCGRTFASRWALAKHARTHTGERPYRCTLCPRTFADQSNLNKHKKLIHKQISLLVNDNNQLQQNQSPQQQQEEGEVEEQLQELMKEDQEEGEEVSIVVTEQQPESEERVIYLAYDVNNTDQTYTILNDEQPSDDVFPDQSLQLQSLESLVLDASYQQRQVTDEQGNPLHVTMQDGTRLAITSVDGKCLQVVTEDGQAIPVEINGYAAEEAIVNADTIVHQLDLQKPMASDETSPVTYFTIV